MFDTQSMTFTHLRTDCRYGSPAGSVNQPARSQRCKTHLQNPSFSIQNSSFSIHNSSFLIQISSFQINDSSVLLTTGGITRGNGATTWGEVCPDTLVKVTIALRRNRPKSVTISENTVGKHSTVNRKSPQVGPS